MDFLIDVRKMLVLEITEFGLKERLISPINAIEQSLKEIKLAFHWPLIKTVGMNLHLIVHVVSN